MKKDDFDISNLGNNLVFFTFADQLLIVRRIPCINKL